MAERVMREGSETSKQMLKVMFEGLSKLVGDAFDAFTDFSRADLRRSREVRNARTTVDPEIAARYQLDPEDMARPDSQNFRTTEEMLLIVRNDDFFNGMKQAMKVAANTLKGELILIGVETDTANSIASWMERISNVTFNLILTHSASGAASSLIKEQIENIVKTFDTVFFDNSLEIELTEDLRADFPIEFAPSYNKETAPFLRFSVDESMEWNEHNTSEFLNDLTETTRILNDLIEVGTNILWRVGYYVAVRDSADVAQDLFGFIGNVDSRAKAIEKVAEFTKYAMSGVLIIEPMLYVFHRGYTRVEDGVYASFGMEPPQDDTVILTQTSEIPLGDANVRRFDLTSSITNRFEQSLTELIEQLKDNHFGNVINTIGRDSSSSYLNAYDDLKNHLNNMKLVFAGVDFTQADQNQQIEIREFFEAEAEWIERHAYFISRLEQVVIDVISMRYEFPSDGQYIALRNHTINRAQGLI
ncbi:hypothetical protein K8I31_21500, partial [bacterium]|nr:hypothetical protein [bacterium]